MLSINQTQKTKLGHVLGQQGLQGLKLLAKSLPELRAEVYAELERNPLIESVSNPLETSLSDAQRKSSESDEPESDYPEEYSPVTSRSEDEDYEERRQAFFDNQVSRETLQQHLTNQLPLSGIAPEDLPLAEMLIGDLDANGYYKGSIPDAAMVFFKPMDEIEKVLAKIREFDPPGCGSRDLRECYLAQLDAIAEGAMRERIRKLLVERFESLEAECAADPALRDALKLMNGTPGRQFDSERNREEYVNPEITAVRRGEMWVPSLDERSIPEFHFSKQYLKLLNDPNAAEETKAYVREKLAAAKALQEAIANRESTVSLVAGEVFARQQAFFEKGFAALKPMTEASVAEAVGVDPSTVSRTVRDKYVATPKGTVELRRFFTSSVKNAAGEDLSQTAVLQALKAIVDSEDPRSPLSDEKLLLKLKERSFDVARRTIAKYRGKLGIPAAARRKVAKVLGAGVLALVVAGCAGLGELFGTRVRLAREGHSLANIVIASDADKAARFGATELAWHLKEITGAEFPIVTDAEPSRGFEIRVGPTSRSRTDRAALKGQQYVVDIADDAIELVGLDANDKSACTYTNDVHGLVGDGWPTIYEAQGTMYAVYDFLEREVGVRWVDATVCGTLLPHEANLSVACDRRVGEPFVLARGGTWDSGHYHVGMWKAGSPNARKYDELAYGPMMGKNREPDRRQLLFLLRHRAGGVRRSACHSFYHFYNRYWLKKSKDFIEYRPDWFSKGTTDASLPAQLCYENPQVISQVVAEVRAYFDDPNPKNRRWGEDVCCLEPMDNSAFCLCDKCRPQYEPDRTQENSQHSTYWFRFVNRVAREIKKSHPDKWISTLAYMTHEGLPTGFEVEDNVVVWFCLFHNRMPFNRAYRGSFARMAAWRERYPNRPIAFWLYNTFPLEFAERAGFNTFPGCYSQTAARQYKFFKKINAREGVVECGINGALESYMQLELLQDPEREADELIDDYLSKYGAAAPALRKFHDLCEERYCDRTDHPDNLDTAGQEASWKYAGTPEVMKKLAGYVAEADRLADTPQAKKALELFKLDLWSYMQKGFDDFWTRENAPYPQFVAKRIPDAGGNCSNVVWSVLATEERPLFMAGGVEKSKWSASVRTAHDGKFLYLEIVQKIKTSMLKPCAEISYYDDLELMFALKREKPYRCWFAGPDGRFYASSFGEVNGRWNCVSDTNYGSRFFGEIRDADHWVMRFAIPLESGLAPTTVKPGDTVWMNAAWTLGPHHFGRGWGLGVCTLTSYTYLHVPDRMASIRLED